MFYTYCQSVNFRPPMMNDAIHISIPVPKHTALKSIAILLDSPMVLDAGIVYRITLADASHDGFTESGGRMTWS